MTLAHRTFRTTVASILCGLAVACASPGAARHDAEAEAKLALYRTHAGAPVSTIPFSRSIDNWTYLGDGSVVLWTSPSRAYLVEVDPGCDELDTAHAIAFEGSGPNVSAGFDSIRVVSPAAPLHIPCRIRTIRPLDVAAIREVERVG
jgi:hypothetical protein